MALSTLQESDTWRRQLLYLVVQSHEGDRRANQILNRLLASGSRISTFVARSIGLLVSPHRLSTKNPILLSSPIPDACSGGSSSLPDTAIIRPSRKQRRLSPGGAHNNDFVDFRKISVLPTLGEMASDLDRVYLPRSGDFLASDPVLRLFDSAFRLLRHDMLSVVRQQLIPSGATHRYANATVNKPFKVRESRTAAHGDYVSVVSGSTKACVSFSVPEGVGTWFFTKPHGTGAAVRTPNLQWFAPGAMIAICVGARPLAFGEVVSNPIHNMLSRHYLSQKALDILRHKLTTRFHCSIQVWLTPPLIVDRRKQSLILVQICASYFAFRPVLHALQATWTSPLLKKMVERSNCLQGPGRVVPLCVAQILKSDRDLDDSFQRLDGVQKTAFTEPFRVTGKLALIQGPPGTGKTFIGTMMALALLKQPATKILLVSFSNHQLDQFLESLLKAGFTDLVRLGGRSKSTSLSPFLLANLIKGLHRKTRYEVLRQEIIRKARLIGCTATGAAINQRLLNSSGCNLLLVEEAGEVLEANLLTCLNENIHRIVMIGDHQQLRPKVNDHALSVESGRGYNLNRSTFERLINDGYRLITLQTQHRMRPEISAIVRDLCYPDLKDAENVQLYKDITQLQANVVFIEKNTAEDEETVVGCQKHLVRTTSKVNRGEAELAARTALFLLKQGYPGEEIAILTPYLGQLHLIRQILETMGRAAVLLQPESPVSSQTLRLATVDNFQGQEARIVIASLVRSNPDGKIGFLGEVQRVNVLVSRAKEALILIGNRTCLHGASPLWRRVLARVPTFAGLPIVCRQHGFETVLKSAADFDLGASSGAEAPLCALAHGCPRCHSPVVADSGQCSSEGCAADVVLDLVANLSL